MSLPLPAQQHGTALVFVRAGSDDAVQEFVVHKALIYHASAVIRNQLQPYDGDEGELAYNFPNEQPATFSTIYHYLYSGCVSKDIGFYTNNDTDTEADTHWLRVFKLAESLQIRGLKITAYERIRHLFASGPEGLLRPSKACATELYSTCGGHCDFRSYIVRAAIWRMLAEKSEDQVSRLMVWNRERDEKEFEATDWFRKNMVMEWDLTPHSVLSEHPEKDEEFKAEALFPEGQTGHSCNRSGFSQEVIELEELAQRLMRMHG